MDSTKVNISVSVATFFLGTIFVLTDHPGITANVIGSDATNPSIASFFGVLMIFGAVALFMAHASHSPRRSGSTLEGDLAAVEKEYRMRGTPEEYGRVMEGTGDSHIKATRGRYNNRKQ
jgi:hypothetical protein